jgi:DNA invertase Pin-like site-specific DNA recombinase
VRIDGRSELPKIFRILGHDNPIFGDGARKDDTIWLAKPTAELAELQRALDYVRAGDTLVVTKVDRLARSTVGLWEIVKRLEAVEDGGVGLRVLNLGGETVDTKSATGKLILTIFAGFAQFEREMMLERQREGIAKAKAENRYMGRRPSAWLKADEAVKLFNAGRSVTDIATALNIGRGSV